MKYSDENPVCVLCIQNTNFGVEQFQSFRVPSPWISKVKKTLDLLFYAQVEPTFKSFKRTLARDKAGFFF